MSNVIGEIFTKEEAEKYYGPVKFSKEIKTDELKNLTAKTQDYIMLAITDGKIEALDHQRKPIISNNSRTVSEKEVFHIISNSVLLDLLEKGGEETSYVEQRTSVFTITNGNSVLEKANPCPPYCCPPYC